jgi:hypothetical protein
VVLFTERRNPFINSDFHVCQVSYCRTVVLLTVLTLLVGVLSGKQPTRVCMRLFKKFIHMHYL